MAEIIRKQDIQKAVPLRTVTPFDKMDQIIDIIKGSTRHKEKEEKSDNYRREITTDSFSRTLTLSAEVDGDKTGASFKDGMLNWSCPKSRRPNARASRWSELSMRQRDRVRFAGPIFVSHRARPPAARRMLNHAGM